jgi:small subunit ribosomal protein S6e
VRREVTPKKEGKKPYTKAPKIQRLITPLRRQRKRHRLSLKIRKAEATRQAAEVYKERLLEHLKERKERRVSLKKRRAAAHKD